MRIIETPRGLETELTIGLPYGVHSRPAAKIAQTARRFDANISLAGEYGEVDAKSMLDILSLTLGRNDKVQLVAKGTDALQAINEISTLLTGSGS